MPTQQNRTLMSAVLFCVPGGNDLQNHVISCDILKPEKHRILENTEVLCYTEFIPTEKKEEIQ